ncbi:MAG: MFS transporter [Candidatus Puniceispirillaceae bacterium]
MTVITKQKGADNPSGPLHLPTLLLIVFIDFIGIGALIPILPYTVIDELGYSASVMTALLACFSLAMFIGNPILGRMSDKVGRKPVLMGSLAVATLAHLTFAFSNHIILLFVSRIIAGLAAGNIGVIQAIIADNTSPDSRAKYMGLMGASIGAGFVFGPALGGLLSGIGGGPLHQAPFALAGLFTLLAFFLCLRLPFVAPVSLASDIGQKQSSMRRLIQLFQGPLGLFALSFFLLNLSFSQVEAAFVLLLKDLFYYEASDTGWLFTYVGICIIIVEGGLIGLAVRRLGETGTIIGGASMLTAGQFATALMAAGLFMAGMMPLAVVIICTTMICVGFAFTNPSLSSAASKAARADEMGGALGLVQGFGSLGQVIGLAAAGPLYAAGSGQLSFGVGGTISLLLLLTIFVIAAKTPKIADTS